ncbi:bifunctional metallophosphatase/5'-nucleotidase, partial [Odoribacter splanchnicus]
GENLARYGETALGDLVADALKWKAGKLNLKVDFALTNSGGIRESLPAGKITKGDVLAVLPFDNVLEVVALSGSEVRRLFDYIASIPLGNGAFAQVSREVRVVYDSGRVRTLTIAGRPIEDDKMYYMATCDYVAAGKDGYEAGLENITGRENTSRSLSDVLIEYIQTKGKIIPRVDGRIKFTD